MSTTCRALYDAEPQEILTGNLVFHELTGCYFSHAPELSQTSHLDEHTPNERVSVRVVHRTTFDHRRYWQLATVWLDESPFMVIQNAGREGDDHYARFITDLDTYGEAVRYLLSLAPVAPADVVDPDEPRDDLDRFYGDSIITAPGTRLRYLDSRQ